MPLLTVLFMSAVMVPLFLPHGVSIDRLFRAHDRLTLFNAAYMAEVDPRRAAGRPAGQEEAASSLGLRWWHVQAFVILPQALASRPGHRQHRRRPVQGHDARHDHRPVDLLGAVNQALKDPAWLGMAHEGYAFAAFAFFICCFLMSSYSRRLERRLSVHLRY